MLGKIKDSAAYNFPFFWKGKNIGSVSSWVQD